MFLQPLGHRVPVCSAEVLRVMPIKQRLNVKLVDKEFRDVSAKIYANQTKNLLNAKIPGVKVRTVLLNPMMGGTDDSPIQVVVKSANPDSSV